MNRREFIKLSGVGLLSMMFGNNQILAKERQINKVDFHAHAILPSYINGLKDLNIDAISEEGFPLPKWSEESHLRFMEEAGIDYTVLSMPTPHISNTMIARKINEEYSAICRKNPDKFGFVATLPLPDVEGSIEEIDYAIAVNR